MGGAANLDRIAAWPFVEVLAHGEKDVEGGVGRSDGGGCGRDAALGSTAILAVSSMGILPMILLRG
jgi:hypothetical protein